VALEERTRATAGGCPYIQKERGGSLSVPQPKGWGMVIGGDLSAAAALRVGMPYSMGQLGIAASISAMSRIVCWRATTIFSWCSMSSFESVRP
jgi:hypothetical protein